MGSVYFVDDNFIGNRKAALDLLPHLVEWQKKTGFVAAPFLRGDVEHRQAAGNPREMREAFFGTIFCGIETPDPVALKAMHKDHNMMVPIMEAIKTLNNYGMEVVSGIILGLDTDKPETGAASARIHRCIADSAVDHQSAAGVAEDAAVGPAETRKPADRGRRPRFQCRFPAAL